MTKEIWPKYRQYTQSLSLETLNKMQKVKEDEVENKSHILRKLGVFEKIERELDFIIDEINRRRDEAKSKNN